MKMTDPIVIHLLDYKNDVVFKQFEEKYDPEKKVDLFLEGVWLGVYMFTPEDTDCDYFQPYTHKIGNFWISFYFENDSYKWDDCVIEIYDVEP